MSMVVMMVSHKYLSQLELSLSFFLSLYCDTFIM
jgi:hypothetical protein